MSNGRITLYNNQPIDILKKLASTSIRSGEVEEALSCHLKCSYDSISYLHEVITSARTTKASLDSS